MNKALPLAALLFALRASTVDAAGINLSWDDCGPNGNEFHHDTDLWSCNTNSDGTDAVPLTHSLHLSYVLPSAIDDGVGGESVLDLQTEGQVLAPWWDFTNCRPGMLEAVFRPASTCPGWPGPAPVAGNIAFEAGFGGATRGRIRTICAYTEGSPQSFVAGVEYVYCRITIHNDKTVGPGSCAGCTAGACLFLNTIKIGRLSNPDIVLSNPSVRNYVTWRGGVGFSCSTPVLNRSWGQIKSLYR